MENLTDLLSGDITKNLIALIAPIGVLGWTLENEKRMKLIELFNEKYKHTFSLRAELSNYLFKKDKINFYYELDIILSDSYIEEKVLDYLTEMEDFFLLLPHHFLTKYTFRRLISLAFYQRIVFLFPYILYKRNATGNNNMFTNYEKAINIMKYTDKIMVHDVVYPKCYIGIRESDISFSGYFFESSICMFSENGAQYPIRTNQNIPDKDILNDIKKKALKKYNCNPEYKFYFYNQLTAYNYPKEIIQNSICINEKEVLEFLNNKVRTKEWLCRNEIPVVSYETLMGNDIMYSALTKCFDKYSAFVIQDAHGGGGIGTYYVDCKNCSEIVKGLQSFQRYLVSPYIPNVSVNTHVFIADKQTVLSPGSVQIIEKQDDQLCYRGADFIVFRTLPAGIRKRIKILSLQIADMLRQKGYRGIAGIDFMVTDTNDIFCCEINPRFQASSLLLDRYLQTKKAINEYEAGSCFEINEMAFKGCMSTTLTYEDIIEYSCYFYYQDNSNIDYIKSKYKLYKRQKKDVYVLGDGIDYYFSKAERQPNKYNTTSKSYLFRVIFNHAISRISPEKTLWINDNIPIKPSTDSPLELKIRLLNQGVRLSTWIKGAKTGVYESIDIKILRGSLCCSGLQINCAYGIHLSQYSPYHIQKERGKEVLYYYNDYVADVEIEQNRLEILSDFHQKILYLATDRLRIKTITGCENKNMGRGCKFCNLPASTTRFLKDDIEQSLIELKKENITFRHILIGGGSCLNPDIWETIIDLCQWLKNDDFYKDKPISIMTMLPPKEILSQLKNAGVEEVAFNLEIANEELAGNLMPGKRNQAKNAYYDVLQEAVAVFGVGKVRSALLVGMDREQELYNEITTLAGLGVLPCLSAFRALPDTLFEKQSGPSNQYLLQVYETATDLLAQMDGAIKELGPDCKECRNNMLAI
ncbi:MAG: ATP-grasp domain-containing protein [Eubacterium sp.]|nr:ATP-grasp domain-containing protein [Eubacterium sp.]